jgi:GNAT superfamily N-acetyltransferase
VNSVMTPRWTIRICHEPDLAPVLAVHQAHAGRENEHPSHREQQTWAQMMATPDILVFLAEESEQPIGTATLTMLPNLTYSCAPSAILEAVVVVPTQRRRGVGSALVDAALDEARVRGADKIQLLSHKRHADDGAHALYFRTGFVAEAEGFRRYLLTPHIDRS